MKLGLLIPLSSLPVCLIKWLDKALVVVFFKCLLWSKSGNCRAIANALSSS